MFDCLMCLLDYVMPVVASARLRDHFVILFVCLPLYFVDIRIDLSFYQSISLLIYQSMYLLIYHSIYLLIYSI